MDIDIDYRIDLIINVTTGTKSREFHIVIYYGILLICPSFVYSLNLSLSSSQKERIPGSVTDSTCVWLT